MKFRCEHCHGIFQTSDDWNDDKAMAEFEAKFGRMPRGEISTLCDECYEEFLRWMRADQ